MKRPIIALALSAFVIPGLGQLYLGRKIKGGILLVAVTLLLLVTFYLLLKLSAPLIDAQLSGTPLTPTLILTQIQTDRYWYKFLLAAFLGAWIYSVLDLLSAFREKGVENDI